MRHSLVVITFLFLSVQSLAQTPDLDHLMKERFIGCADIFMNCTTLLPEYYSQAQPDSMRMVVDYWKDRCGSSEASMRIEILMNIDKGIFSDDLYPQLLSELRSYRDLTNQRYDMIGYRNDDMMRWDTL